MSPRRDWHSWENYQVVHERALATFYDHFLLENRLRPDDSGSEVLWNGVLYCVDGLEIHISKRQKSRYRHGHREVRTYKYSYHLQRRVGSRVTPIFRYDNVHQHPGHPDAYHRHRFGDDGSDTVEHVGAAAWPVLSDVLEEAYRWWLDHLPD